MPEGLRTLAAEVSAWSSISIHPHRFGGREFRFGHAEVGHVHTGGIVDISFPRSIHDALLAEGPAGWAQRKRPRTCSLARAAGICPQHAEDLI
jgi:hypothetical protein